MLSPNIPTQQPVDTPIPLSLSAKSPFLPASSECTVSEGEFRIAPDPANSKTRIILPPLEKWLFGSANSSGADENNTIDSLYAILADVDAAQRKNCFPTNATPVRAYVLQSIPTRPSDSLFNAYGYRIERSAVNLKFDLRLKIERAYFRGGSGGDSVKNYLGISDALFDVTTDDEGSLRFRQAHSIQYSPASLADSNNEGSRDLAILDLKPQGHYRLLFYTHQVPTDRNFSAALIGAQDLALLDQFEQAMRADSGASCSTSTHEDVQCLEFRGFVTVSVQIPVELNEKPQFVDWGTKVKSLVPAKAQKHLKIQRQFQNSYFPIQFDRADPSILDLTLVGADRLSW